MPNLPLARLSLVFSLLASTAAHGSVASFDDLPNLPPLDAGSSLAGANNGSLDYQGVSWDARFSVVGDQYKVNPNTDFPPNPNFGIPHSGHYFVTNQDGNTGLLITTNQILTGAWFGRNEYYGYGAGADQITLVALSAAGDLASVVFDLPENHPGEPEPLSFVDTSSFAGLTGITGYRIDRRMLGELSGHWVADDFSFTPVPLPPALGLFASAVAGLGWLGRRRK